MNKEYKELLLKDLCARLSYGVIVSPIDCGKAKLIGFKDDHPILFDLVSQKEYDKPWEIEYIKPYLRPMSSITEEEKKELQKIAISTSYNKYDVMVGVQINSFQQLNDALELFNSHHFDYRGLIEKGLAIEVTKENNPYENDI